MPLLPSDLQSPLDSPTDPFVLTMNFLSALVSDLVFTRKFTDVAKWNRCAGVYLQPWLSSTQEDSAVVSENIRNHFLTLDKVR